MALVKVPPHARAGSAARGHRFAAYPRCWADLAESGPCRTGMTVEEGRPQRAIPRLLTPLLVVVLGVTAWWAVRAAAEIWLWICPTGTTCRAGVAWQLGT